MRKFLETEEVKERKQLGKSIYTILNSFSVCNSDLWNVRLGEKIFRDRFLHAEEKSIEERINIYAHILVVMLQHGLQLKTIHEESNATGKLLDILRNIIISPHYYPTSYLRRNIETVIKMLSILSDLNKQQKLLRNVYKCFNEITSMDYFHEEKVKSYLKKYLKSPTWIELYLVITWLKIKVVCTLCKKMKDISLD